MRVPQSLNTRARAPGARRVIDAAPVTSRATRAPDEDAPETI